VHDGHRRTITLVVGVILALHQDVGLSVILVIAMPVCGVVLGLLVSRMVPAFRLMQERIDQVNRVLREQITGIRWCVPSCVSRRKHGGSRRRTKS